MQKSNINNLTKTEQDQLKTYYASHSLAETARQFKVGERALRAWLEERQLLRTAAQSTTLGHEKAKKEIERSPETENLILRYYETHSQIDTLKEFHLDSSTFKKILDKYGVKCRSLAEARAVASTNHLRTFGVKFPVQRQEIKEKIRQSNQEKYGTDYPVASPEVRSKSIQTKIQRYGDENYNNSTQRRITCQEKYGTPSASGSASVRAKIIATSIDHYGVDNPAKSQEVKDKIQSTKIQRYGGYGWDAPSIRQQYQQTCQEKYGVSWYCQAPGCRNHSKSNSAVNQEFRNLLTGAGIPFESEFVIEPYSYDFKVGGILIEIDPWITHNVDVHPYNKPVTKFYHRDKTQRALESGYRCIHVFDWDNKGCLLNQLKARERIFARNCTLEAVTEKEAQQFLTLNHLQGYVKASISLGLYYQESLVSIMTFGKPRYNKNCEWELLRYCSIKAVVGGAEKLFKHFTLNHPGRIVSYCDLSKFDGSLYERLGFTSKRISVSKHWYNPKTKQHLTDNLLRQRGFDQLFGTSYGKGTSNEQLMLDCGFVEIYDAGQQTFEY